jgi:hypothetical protein
MEIKLISKQPFIFRISGHDYEFVKPYYLMKCGGFHLLKGTVKGSTLCWNVGGSVVTYNAIRNVLKPPSQE